MKSKLILKKWQKIVLLCILPFAAAALFLLLKQIYGKYVMPHVKPCLLRSVTGLQCPNCGMTHSAFALARLDLVESARQNIMLPLAVLAALLRYAELWTEVLGKPKRLIPRGRLFWPGVLAFWLGYAVLRNLL
ncbi:MAG: DUF2752 domain-containing protein [Oscillospiraceae bacterium]|nr:DUF2752 domain-containing protein [Oscillospiraceae bacterium]